MNDCNRAWCGSRCHSRNLILLGGEVVLTTVWAYGGEESVKYGDIDRSDDNLVMLKSLNCNLKPGEAIETSSKSV